MRNARSLAQMAIVGTVLAAGAAACSSSSSVSTDPLTGMSSKQIANQAVTGTEAAPSVRITGTGSDSGQAFSIDLTVVKGKGCQGGISEGSAGSFKLVYDGSTAWVLPDSKFYQTSGVPTAARTILDGKYLKVKATTGNGIGSLAQICTISKLLAQFSVDAGSAKGTKTTVSGQPAIKIIDKTGTGYAYVTDATSPELLQITKPGSGGGTISFSYSGTTTITPPPASQVIDGSKYGF